MSFLLVYPKYLFYARPVNGVFLKWSFFKCSTLNRLLNRYWPNFKHYSCKSFFYFYSKYEKLMTSIFAILSHTPKRSLSLSGNPAYPTSILSNRKQKGVSHNKTKCLKRQKSNQIECYYNFDTCMKKCIKS